MTRTSRESARSAVPSYTRTAIVLHWLVAAALAVQVLLGWWMQTVPKSPPGQRAGWYNLHKSIGLTIAALVLLRLAWRIAHPVAASPVLPRWQSIAARCNHALLYGCMVAMPLTGYLGSTFTRYPVRYFGLVLPSWNRDWPAAKELMSQLHLALSILFVLLIAVHVAAALWHAWRGDGVVERMGWHLHERTR